MVEFVRDVEKVLKLSKKGKLCGKCKQLPWGKKVKEVRLCEFCGESYLPGGSMQKYCETHKLAHSRLPKNPEICFIQKHKCQIKNCQKKAIAIAKGNFLCKVHYQQAIIKNKFEKNKNER